MLFVVRKSTNNIRVDKQIANCFFLLARKSSGHITLVLQKKVELSPDLSKE